MAYKVPGAIQRSDRRYSGATHSRIFVSGAVSARRALGHKTLDYFNAAVKELRGMLNLPDVLTLRFADLGRTANGTFYSRSNLVEIEAQPKARRVRGGAAINVPWGERKKVMLLILCHELVHADQYHSGRLKGLMGNSSLWDNRTVYNGDTYDQYWNLPWEIEARAMEVTLADAVMAVLGDPDVVTAVA